VVYSNYMFLNLFLREDCDLSTILGGDLMSQQYKTEDQYSMVPLRTEQLQQELDKLPEWKQLDDQWIAREYKFNAYLDGVEFAKNIGEYVKKRQHHPIIFIDYKKITVIISSWRAKGVTELDIEMVKDFDGIYKK